MKSKNLFGKNKQKGFSPLTVILTVVIFLLLISNGVSIYLLYQKVWQTDNYTNVGQHLQANVNISKTNVNKTNDDLSANQSDELVEPNDGDETKIEQKVNLAEGEIWVAWNEWPVKTNCWNFFDYVEVKKIIAKNNDLADKDAAIDDMVKKYNIYKVGKIKSGPYIDKELFIITFTPEGMAFRDEFFRVIKNDKELIHLANHSDQIWGKPETDLFVSNKNIKIANLEPPATIKIPKSKFSLTKEKDEPFALLTNYENPRKLFRYNDQDYVYKDKSSNCFIVEANDGSVRLYYFDLDFLGSKGDSSQYSGAIPYQLDFSWLNGEKNRNEYIFKDLGGCGARGCYNYADYIKNIDQLTKVGRTVSGDIIYELKDKNFKIEKDKSILETMYDSYYPGYDPSSKKSKEKISFEAFLDNHPIIYWQDPFGDFIEFRNVAYLPAVECGKPVIYLYPKQEIDVSVQIEPKGGFSVTEPAYNNGWLVKAFPNGKLYNYSDQKNYPYLFWEGYGLNYIRPEKGFVVAKDEVEKFMQEKLAQLGLIKNEYEEFIEFWLPKMQQRKYYFITFVPQEEFDRLAPLAIDPKPDTIIRVFMDYQGLDEYIEVKPQIITTPERKGFTAVEWGGALHK